VSFSFQASATIPDGGDQLSALLTLLLLPIALTDERKWHWSFPKGCNLPPTTNKETLRRITARMAFLLIQLQVAAVYFHSSISKLAVEEWANGTAMYYWLIHPTFGVPYWLRGIVYALVTTPIGVACVTWGVVVFEFLLAIGVLFSLRSRCFLLQAGIVFHCAIAVLMGLTSFSVVMIAALVLLLQPADKHIRWLDGGLSRR
jgi:sporulation delaying protein B